jgi:dihydrofolate reductase
MPERFVIHDTFVIERTYPASPARVFAAWADPAVKSRWFVGLEEGQIAGFMNAVPKVAYPMTLTSMDWNNTAIVSDNVAEEISKLKEQPGGNIFVFGIADFTSTLINLDLVEEYRFGINPVLLAAGIPFFKGGFGTHDLKLGEAKLFNSGLVILHYTPQLNRREPWEN